MAEPATLPSIEEIERASAFAREPFLLEGEDAARRARSRHPTSPGARRRARPSWRPAPKAVAVTGAAQWSLLLGLERLLSPGRAAARRRHGALRAPGRRAVGHADRAARRPSARSNGDGGRSPPSPSRVLAADERSPRAATRTTTRTRRAARSWDAGRAPDETLPRGGRARRGARGPERRQALLVRARDRRRQDRRRGRLRRGVPHRRRPDPHPPPQPRRPVPRRAARPRRTPSAICARAARATATHAERPGHGRDLPVVRPQRGQQSPTRTRSSSATRRTPRWARRRRPRSAPGPAPSSSA